MSKTPQTIWPWQKGKSISAKKPGKASVKSVKKTSMSLERMIGENWLQKIGVIMVLLGISYFLKYSFEQGWIGPVAQVGIGVFIGLLFVGAGEFFVKKYQEWAHVLTGAGIAILYFSLFAARSQFGLFSDVTAFVSMIPVTLLAGLLAIRYNSLPLTVFGIVGGFVAPLLMGSETPNYVLTLSYSLVLSLGVFGIAYFKRWPLLEFLAFSFSIYYWEQSFGLVPLNLALGLLGGFFLLFSFLPFYPQAIKKTLTDSWSLFLILFNGVFTYFYLYRLLEADTNQLTWGITGLAFLYFVETMIGYRRNAKDRALTYTLLGSGLVVLTTILPIQTEGYPLTFGVLMETLVVFWIGLKLKMVWLRRFGMALGVLGFYYLFNTASHVVFTDSSFVLNAWTGVLTMAVLAYGSIAWLYKYNKKIIPSSESFVIPAALFLANVSLLQLLTLQVDHVLYLKGLTGSVLDFVLEGIIVALYGVFLFQQGFRLSLRTLKYLGFFVLATALPSLFEAGTLLFRQPELFMSIHHGLVLLSIIAMVLCIHFVKQLHLRYTKGQEKLLMGFSLVDGALLFCLLNFEINYFFEFQTGLAVAEEAAFSVGWALFSIAYLVLGILKRVKTYRWIGLLGFAITIVKVLSVDIKDLSSIYRIIAFIGLGVLLILSSFLYQRFKKLIHDKVL